MTFFDLNYTRDSRVQTTFYFIGVGSEEFPTGV